MRDNKFREEPMIFEDVEWWNDYALPGGKIETKRLSKVLVDYRVRGNSLSERAIPGRRKRLVKKLALSVPGARWVLLTLTWLAYLTRRSTVYKHSWTLGADRNWVAPEIWTDR